MNRWESFLDRIGRAAVEAARPASEAEGAGGRSRLQLGGEPQNQTGDTAITPNPYEIGVAVGQLFSYGQEWVRRRTETFEFTSATTARRQMAVDFALPKVADEDTALDVRAVRAMVDAPGPSFVPLTTLRKAPLAGFDLFDEERRTLPLLTSEENGRMTGDALVALAYDLRDQHDLHAFPRSLRDALTGIAQLPAEPAKRLFCCLTAGTAQEWDVIQTLAPPIEGKADTREPHDRELYSRAAALRNLEQNHAPEAQKVRELMKEEPLRALTRKLASDFAVLVALEGDVYGRRVIKLAYEEPLAHRSDYKEQGWLRRTRRRTAERLSWTPKTFAFSRIAAGDAVGHHVELVAPADMDIVRASFTAYVPSTTPDTTPAADHAVDVDAAEALGTEVTNILPADRRVLAKPDNPLRAHMNLSRLPPQAVATARVQLRGSSSGLLNAATGVALLIVGVLWWGYYRAYDISEADAAAAILLVAPTLLAASIARPGEHELVSVAMSGVRFLVAVAGLLMLVAASSLAFGYKEQQLSNIWCVLRWAALVPAAGLLWSSVRVRWPRFPRNLFRSAKRTAYTSSRS